MADKSRIEWTETTWNPIRGCSRVSPECDHCYAMREARRHDHDGGAYEGLTRMGPNGPDWNGQVRPAAGQLLAPLGWKRPRMVFVASMSDPLHAALDRDWLDQMHAVMALTPHTYQQLTKRTGRQREYYQDPELPARIIAAGRRLGRGLEFEGRRLFDWPLPNLIVGASIGLNAYVKSRALDLVKTPAARRMLSLEPLLEDIADELEPFLALTRQAEKFQPVRPEIDWLVIGGESSYGARPCQVGWIRKLVRLGRRYGQAVFVKQLGARIASDAPNLREWPDYVKWGRTATDPHGLGFALGLHHKKGGDPAEWPADLRVREFPR